MCICRAIYDEARPYVYKSGVLRLRTQGLIYPNLQLVLFSCGVTFRCQDLTLIQILHVDIDCLRYDVWLEGHRETHIRGDAILNAIFGSNRSIPRKTCTITLRNFIDDEDLGPVDREFGI